MAQYSSSASTNSSTSKSTSTPVQTPQSQWSLALSQILSNLGQYQYNWAQQQFNNTASVTDAQINNYLTEAQQGSDLASNLNSRYQSTFEPLENQYIQEAGSYASQPRINYNMGAAEANANQANTQGLINAEQQLQSYGIDPSSGRYADLLAAQKTAGAASEAAAGQQAELNTEATGRQMLLNSVEMGQQLPGATVNALNSAYQGIAGAENAQLGLENTGVALTDSANPYYSSAMGVKLPTNATTSTSSGSGQSGAVGGGGGGGIKNGGYDPTAGFGSLSASQWNGSNPNRADPSLYNTPYQSSVGSSGFGVMQGQPQQTGGAYGGSPNTGAGGVLPFDQNSVGPTYLPQASGSGDSVWDNPTIYGNAGGNYSNAGSNTMGTAGGSGNYGYYGDAKGGAIPDNPQLGNHSQMTSGGHVSQGLSPSGGAQTDDIPARLNAREFVIPQDVADWKGQEFFQKLIADSRRARLGAPAKPARKTAPMPSAQQPRFVSQHMQPQQQPQAGAQ